MIKEINEQDLLKMKDKEGLILQGCGGDLNDWLQGINEDFTKRNILMNNSKFEDIYSFKSGEITNLLFPLDYADVNIPKLAMWRIGTHEVFGGTWLSDYIDNRLSDKEAGAFFGGVQLDTFQYKMVNGQLSDIPNPLYNTYHFMSTLPRYHNMDDFLKAAQQYLNSIELSKVETIEGESEEERRVRVIRKRFLDYCDRVVACNTKLGKSGADIVYPKNIWDTDVNKNGILIIEVKSFPANLMLHSHTSHCIKDSIGNWDS